MTNDETTEETIVDGNSEENISDDSSNDNSEDNLEQSLKNRLELELGLPLTPKFGKQVDQSFDDNTILIDDFPVQSIKTLKIGNKILGDEDYILNESEGCIYLKEHQRGFLYLEYCYGLAESEYKPLLDLMVEYESDNSWNKDASSIKENNVAVSYDTSVGKGARIVGMIQDLRCKYSCRVEMI